MIQQPPKPGALIRPPQVTLTQTPMVALRQPHSRIVLTAPQQIQLNQLQPGEGPPPPVPLTARACRAAIASWPRPQEGLQGQTQRCWIVSQASPVREEAQRVSGE